MSSVGLRLFAGSAVWFALLVYLRPSPLEVGWARLVLLLGPLVIVPLGMRLVPRANENELERRLRGAADLLQLPSALLFAAAFLLEQGVLAVLLAAPWTLTTTLIALQGLARVRRRGLLPLGELTIDAGLVYLVVGASWAMADRIGYRPLDFDPVIVLLTSIHFHYAGFALPVLAGLAQNELSGRSCKVTAVTVVAGVPLVAVGITASQLGYPTVVETFAAWFLALGGAATAWLTLGLARDSKRPIRSRRLWAVSAVSLAFSMLLAGLYGTRFHLDLAWLDIPFMRALHGTSNALGFALCGMLAWLGAGSAARQQSPGA